MWNDDNGALSEREVSCIRQFFEQRGYTVEIDEFTDSVTLTRLSFTRTIELGSFRLLCQSLHLKGERGGRMSKVGQAFADVLGPGFVQSSSTGR
jgi:hypothetical protein